MLGRVQRLWRYPVKSLLGEPCACLSLDARGVAGDRAYAIRDADGKLGSGKSTRRFRRIDGLLNLEATYQDAVATVRFPNDTIMRADDPAIHGALSSQLGQAVTLVPEADVPHFDNAAVHLLTTASLAWLKAALPHAAIDERRFRPNLVIETPDQAPLEHTWLGRVVQIGDGGGRLRIIERAERCGMIALPQRDLPGDPAILRHVTEYADLQFGVYAEVVMPGRIRCGDIVRLAD
jgi:MOSC domain-containing protein